LRLLIQPPRREWSVVHKFISRVSSEAKPQFERPAAFRYHGSIPVMVRDPVRCKQISDILLDRYGICVQPINYPTVACGTERLRITPSPHHSDADIEALVAALSAVWTATGLTEYTCASLDRLHRVVPVGQDA
jgi:7-keto-8-aminopelargonate synthetase-like enzyme